MDNLKHDLPTIEEKIDYIYERMRKQQKVETFALILKWGTRLFIVISIAYFFFVKLPALKDDIINSLKPDIPSFNTESITNSDLLNTLKERFLGDDEAVTVDPETSSHQNNSESY